MEPNKRQKTITTIVGIVVGIGVMILVQQAFFKTQSFDQAMMEAASELNKSCPIMIDQETRLDNTVAMPENIFQYNYTLVNLEKSSVDVDELTHYLEPTIVNNVRTNPDLKIYRENKTTMAYYYKDKHGVFLTEIKVTPERYE